MSSYATLEQLKAHVGPVAYGQLTDLAGGTTASDSVGQQRIDDAAGEVNSLLGARYATPISVADDAALAATLRGFTLAIAVYRAYAAHPARPRISQAVSDEYRNVIARLQAIAGGQAALPGATELPGPASGGPTAIVTGSPRVFADEAMRGL